MSDHEEEQHETFENVGSGASLTYPMQVFITDQSHINQTLGTLFFLLSLIGW